MTDDILMVYFSLTFLSPTIVVSTGRRGRRAQANPIFFLPLYYFKIFTLYVISMYTVLATSWAHLGGGAKIIYSVSFNKEIQKHIRYRETSLRK